MSFQLSKKLKWLGVAAWSAAPAAFADGGMRQQIEGGYGLRLMDGEGSERWTAEEEQGLLMLLESLPSGLSMVAKRATTGKIRVFKNFVRQSRTDHKVLPGFDWQMTLDLAAGQPLTTRSLQRRLVHHMLHVYNLYERHSASDEWRRLSGWQYRRYFGVTLDFLPKESLNQDPRGFASAEGMQDATEDFVTSGTAFFVPDGDSLACQLPDKFNFFRRLFPESAAAQNAKAVACVGSANGFLDDLAFFDPLTGKRLEMGPVDAGSVRGFELLYATPGVGDAAEVAGHLVLRIKLANNPVADALGIENPNDLVVSFLADTDGPATVRNDPADASAYQCEPSFWQIGGQPEKNYDAVASVTQALRGLSGGFLTTFDRQTLLQTVKNYTIDQDRNLLRYRLNLTADQQRRLIERLYAVKQSYKTKYYFFDRNCASVLVQIIGEGIGNNELAHFSPLVSPPNSLIAMLLRQKLATQEFPSFYSYRRRGHVAQSALAEMAPKDLRRKLLSNDPKTRLRAYKKLFREASPDLDAKQWQMASIGQDAELAHAIKGGQCEDMTSPVTAYLREIQRAALTRRPALASTATMDVNRLIEARYGAVEAQHAATGSEHTSLSSLFVGPAGYRDGAGGWEPGVAVDFALFRQAMGANSRVTMQRATSVQLGEFKAVATDNAEGGSVLAYWRATGLSLRKFKERLDGVPSYVEPPGGFGLGLTVLDVEGSRDAIDTTLARGEVLANVWSAPNYDSYFFLGAGGAVHVAHQRGEGRLGGPTFHVTVPLRAEGLWSVDSSRARQLRAAAEYAHCIGNCVSQLRLSASYAQAWFDDEDSQLLWRASVERQGLRDLMMLGLEWNRW